MGGKSAKMTCILPSDALGSALAAGLLAPGTVSPQAVGGLPSGTLAASNFAKLLHAPRAAHASGVPPEADMAVDPPDDASGALDPAVRHAAHLAASLTQPRPTTHPPERPSAHAQPPVPDASPASAAPPAEVRAAASLEELLPALVRSIAWNAQGHRGVVHLELGAGSLSGTRLVIEAEGGRLRVTIAPPPSVRASVELAGWSERIAARLAARGLDVGSVEVT
jgi:hypothetical protein